MIDLTQLSQEQQEHLQLSPDEHGLDRAWSGKYLMHKDLDKLVIVYYIDYFNDSNKIDALQQAVRLTASKDDRRIRRDPSTGELVLQYVQPEGTELRYAKKGVILPHDGTDFVDWQKVQVEELDLEGQPTGNMVDTDEYVINPDWDDAIDEFTFFSSLIDSGLIDIRGMIVNTFIDANIKKRFDV